METKYMQGWRDAGWTILIIVLGCLLFIWAGETCGQVQNHHLSVIAKKNSGSSPSVTHFIVDTSFTGGSNDEWVLFVGGWSGGAGTAIHDGATSGSAYQDTSRGMTLMDAGDYTMQFKIINCSGNSYFRVVTDPFSTLINYDSRPNGYYDIDFTLADDGRWKVQIYVSAPSSDAFDLEYFKIFQD